MKSKFYKQSMWNLYRWIAFKLPKGLVYWASLRLLAHATSGKYSNEGVPSVSAIDAIDRWE